MTTPLALTGTLTAVLIGASALLPLTASSEEPPALCGSRPAIILGTPGDDFIYGTDGDDIIAGMGGNDRIFGLGGNDRICGDVNGVKRGGNDIIDAGAGSDRVLGNAADITTEATTTSPAATATRCS